VTIDTLRPGAIQPSGVGDVTRLGVAHLLLTMDVGGLEQVALDLVRLADPQRSIRASFICAEAGTSLRSLRGWECPSRHWARVA
jgi:hypothetical protein